MSCLFFLLPGCNKLRSVQVWPPSPERVADDVRPGQDVPTLPESLEAGDADQQTAQRGHGRHADVQSQLYQVLCTVTHTI